MANRKPIVVGSTGNTTQEIAAADTCEIGSVSVTNVASVALTAGIVNDYSPTGWAAAAVLRITTGISAGVRTITGFVAPSGCMIKTIVAVSGDPVVLANENASSTATNRISIAGDLALYPGDACILQYDTTSSRWRAAASTRSPANTPINVITGVAAQALVNNRYVTNNASTRVVITLPATAAVGDVVEIIGLGAGGWELAQNSGQQINANTSTTVGTGGFARSGARYDCIKVVCAAANTTWVRQHQGGSPTFT